MDDLKAGTFNLRKVPIGTFVVVSRVLQVFLHGGFYIYKTDSNG